MRRMLQLGYIVSTGGGARDVVILTPPLTIDDLQREPFISALTRVLRSIA
jgi:4-aminobutyrate aminotransferase-like enzyme